jgi:predicted DNA-binding transcriptional regulator AlpA
VEQQPISGLITGRQIGALFGLSRTSIYRMTRDGRFPVPCDIGNGKIRWREDEVRDWLSKLPSRQYPAPLDFAKRGNAPKHNGGGHA